MIKEKDIEINITPRNVSFYKDKGYDFELGNKEYIKINDLPKSSHVKITAVCDICGKEKKIIYAKYIENYNRHGFYSCKSCSNIKRVKTSMDKWGVSNYRKTKECESKIEETNLKRYGVKHTLQSDEIKDKIKKTNKDKYGTEYHLSSNIIRNKIKETTLRNWGVEHFSKTQQFYKLTYNKWKKQMLEKLKKYDITDFKLKKDRTVDIKCDCGKDHYFNINSKNLYQRKEIQNTILCTECNKIDMRISGQEIFMREFIDKNTDERVLNNVKDLISKELDIYIPSLNIAFEYNGIYWHSDLYKNKDYHLNKTNECEKHGIQLIHIYEDDWIYKQDIVKSMILNKLGKIPNRIFARKTEVREIQDNKLVREFLNNNHIQGFVGSKIKIGLFYEKELVSLMTFGKNRRNLGHKNDDNDTYEMIRFCNKLNTSVIGGASKMLKHFINNYKPKSIISYANRSHSNGKLYEKLNFELVKKTVPGYSYYDSKMNKYNRFNFRKDVLIKKGFDKNKTSHDIMDELGYYRVYNSGNLKYKLNI
jgi:hypothetical protein